MTFGYDVVFLSPDWEYDRPTITTISDNFADIINNDLGKYVLVGHSFGGKIAVNILRALKKRPEKIILIGSPNIVKRSLKIRIFRILSNIKNYLRINLKTEVEDDDWIGARGSNLENLYKETIDWDQTDQLKEIQDYYEIDGSLKQKSVYILHGENDLFVPLSIANSVSKLIGNSSLKILKGLGHDPHIENPIFTAGILNKIIKDEFV